MTATRPSSYIETRDGVRLYRREWGTGTPVLFVHSWAVSSRLWDYQFAALGDAGVRCLAYDRRGHGRSDEPAGGYDFDTLADDLADVIEALDVDNLTLVGHSMGPGEIVRYLTRHGDAKVKRLVFLAPALPFLKQTPDNPGGIPEEMLEALRGAWRQDFPKWIVDNTPPFFTPETSPEMMRWGAEMLLKTSLPVAIACNRAVTDTDFRAELKQISRPTLLIHGDKDASAPLALTGEPAAALIPGCEFKVYEGAPHGLMFTHAERLNADLLAFIRD
jgi:pimeloyl-ACP methyl ester carboxylesterase